MLCGWTDGGASLRDVKASRAIKLFQTPSPRPSPEGRGRKTKDRMPRWVRLLAAEECPPGEARECVAEDRIVAVFNVDGQFFALDGICPHQGGPLGQGRLTGCIVTCPWHGWQFDATTGQHQTSKSLQHPRFAVKVEGGEVFADLESDSPG